ncbi:MAG TPA: hypothetical protein VGE52_19900, partial [Pirellulales bacterium]
KDGRQRPATQPPRPAKAGVEAETVKHAARHDDEHDDKSREEFTHAERPIAERHPVVATDTSPAAPARSAAFNHQGFVEPLRRLGSFIDERANAVGRRDREYHRALELWREMAAVLATWTGHDPTESDARRRMLAR